MDELENYDILNEEMSALATTKLRDAIHDILTSLDKKETIDIEELSDRLISEFRINISPFFLDEFFTDYLRARRGEKISTFFRRDDAKWLDVRDVKGTKELRNNLLFLKPSLSKYKRKIESDNKEERLEHAYKQGMMELNFKEDVIKSTLIFQRPRDSKDMIKKIYSDVIIDKKYYNTYDNCWKLMILIARRNNLDRRTGYFKLAPQSVKDEYKKNSRVNLELKEVPKEKRTSTKQTKNTDKDNVPDNTERNLIYMEENYEYNNWDEFKQGMGLSKIIGLIDNLVIHSKYDSFQTFLGRTDELIYILSRFYRVKRQDIIGYFREVGLDKFIRDWKKDNARPKINDF